ncbi:MAG: hypothetical protein PHX19_03325 [Bacilli bacterium]|nr:hypothetical protein [Bacilli bacterium]MDD4408061.1 hypothetical protein [Bacilli bacterium]
MDYLLDLGFNDNEIKNLKSSLEPEVINMLLLFPKIVAVNYQILNEIGVKNIKEVFSGHVKMFLINPDRFKAIFAKYDQADLIRCIEKNADIVDKL